MEKFDGTNPEHREQLKTALSRAGLDLAIPADLELAKNIRTLISAGDCPESEKAWDQRISGAIEHLKAKANEPTRGWVGCIYGKGKVGKCLKIGTPIMLHDGRIVPVELIEIGDHLMGPDSLPRIVQSIDYGYGELVEIKPKKGDSFFCTPNHKLTIKNYLTDSVIDISVEDYIRKNPTYKENSSLIRAIVEFDAKQTELDPYFVGVWIGDGTARSSSVQITKIDFEVFDVMDKVASEHGLIRKTTRDNSHRLSREIPNGKTNQLISKIRKMVNYETGEKKIPREYIINSRVNRLELLAGLLDTDGYLDRRGHLYEFSTKWLGIAKDVQFLSKTLGFSASIKEKTVKGKKYYRMAICGNVGEIPCRIKRKIAKLKSKKSKSAQSAFDILPAENGEWVGIEVDGDHRIVLGDLTVTHNSTLAMLAPDPFCADIEDGLGWIDGPRKECASWQEFNRVVADFLTSNKKTLIIDTADMLEKHMWESLMIEHKLKSMKADWHAGYALAAQEWCRFLQMIRGYAAKKNKNFLFTAHQKISTVTNTEGEAYEQASINLHKDSAEMFFSQMDFCAYAHFETITRKNENKDILGITSGKRMLNIGCDTLSAQVGNRFNIQGKVPMDANFYKLLGRKN